MQGRRQLPPIQMCVDQVRIGGHDGTHLLGDRSDLREIGSEDAEQHGIVHRRSEDELADVDARLGEAPVGDHRSKTNLESIPADGIVGSNDDLSIGRVGQKRIERQDETRCSSTDVARDDFRFRLFAQDRLDFRDGALARCEGASRRHEHFDREFRPIRIRKELLHHRAHADHRETEHGERQTGDERLVIDAGADDAAKTLIVFRGVDRRVATRDDLDVGQDFHPDVGHEIDRDDPGRQATRRRRPRKCCRHIRRPWTARNRRARNRRW